MFTSFTLVLPREHCSTLQAISSKQVCSHSSTKQNRSVSHCYLRVPDLYPCAFQHAIRSLYIWQNTDIFLVKLKFIYFIIINSIHIYFLLVKANFVFTNPKFTQQLTSPQYWCFQVGCSHMFMYHL